MHGIYKHRERLGPQPAEVFLGLLVEILRPEGRLVLAVFLELFALFQRVVDSVRFVLRGSIHL